MALITRRYRFVGPSSADLANEVQVGASNSSVGGTVTDVQVDDALPGIVETIDEFMSKQGFTFVEQSPPVETTFILRSPGGLLFEIQVSDLGVLVVIPL